MKLYLILLLVVYTVAEEKWSWGKLENSRQPKSISNTATIAQVNTQKKATVSKPATIDSALSQTQTRETRKIQTKGNGKSEGRFLGLHKKMCEYGLGFDVSF